MDKWRVRGQNTWDLSFRWVVSGDWDPVVQCGGFGLSGAVNEL